MRQYTAKPYNHYMKTVFDQLADTPLSDADFRRGQIALLPRKARLAAEMTQQAFAEAYGIPVGTLRDWEQGRKEPDAAAKQFLTLIRNNPKSVLDQLHAVTV